MDPRPSLLDVKTLPPRPLLSSLPGPSSVESTLVAPSAASIPTAVPSDLEKLTAAVPTDLAQLIHRFPQIFPDDLPEGFPPKWPFDHLIKLEPGTQPTVQRRFRLTQPELEELRKQLDYLLEKKFIRPSSSPFAAPMLFTPKKDGGYRMCNDYRALNRVTIRSRYPIPRTDELINQLQKARLFSEIDLRGGYPQIRLVAADCHKNAFCTRYGSFEYIVMPFGLTNAPATFQMTMNQNFSSVVDRYVIVYLDDIVIYSETREQHLKDLEAVFMLLWGEKEQAAFSSLKTFLCSTLVLCIADPHRPFKVITDASDIANGAVLLQDFGEGLQPIAYESRELHPPERNYPIHDKEMLAIVHAFKVWRCYLTART
ncbi:hypothetical protein CLOM_g19175 [Closterium sp. NIES-68]|nr:hypothetical protein CLOM_g19175 [Closterium sp. NIES-68]